jgi:hypothetical protein
MEAVPVSFRIINLATLQKFHFLCDLVTCVSMYIATECRTFPNLSPNTAVAVFRLNALKSWVGSPCIDLAVGVTIGLLARRRGRALHDWQSNFI